MDKQKLIAFENKIAELFSKAKIRAPIHLYSNNEEQMIKIFKKSKKMIGFFVLGVRIISAC